MKRMLRLTACTLLMFTGIAGIATSAAHADHGGQNQPVKTRVRIALNGAAIGGISPQGHADFRSESDRRQLNVEVEKVDLPDDTVLSVNVNGAPVGTITLTAKRGKLELNSKDGAVVPAIKSGDVVTVTTADKTQIETGTF